MNCIFYIVMVQFFIFQNLQVQTETLFEDRPLSQEVDNVVPLEEFHAELQIESHHEGLEQGTERQDQVERVAQPDDAAVSSIERTDINQKYNSGQVGKEAEEKAPYQVEDLIEETIEVQPNQTCR